MFKIINKDEEFLEKVKEKFEEIKELNNSLLKKNRLNDINAILKIVEEAGGLQLITQPHCLELIEKDIMNLLSNLAIDKSPQEVMSLLTQPEEISTLTKERLDFFKMIVDFKKKGVNKKRISEHFHKYIACFMNESAENNENINQEWLEKEVKNDLKSKDIIYFEGNYNSIIEANKKLILKKEETARKYKITKKILDLCKVLESLSHYRLESHLIWMVWLLQISKLVDQKAKELNVPKIILENMRLSEFVSLKDKTDFDRIIKGREISSRMISLFAIVIDKNYIHKVLYDKKAKEFLDEEKIILDPPKLKYLKGDIAFPGKVVGRAIIIDDTKPMGEHLKRMRKGDVLVAWQTKPDMLPAIIKASAIVTNEGGIISHAAIVAREFKKPCVMMTRWATNFLREGDLVEVDANKGIVRILKRA